MWLNIGLHHSAREQSVSLAFAREEQMAQWLETMRQQRADMQLLACEQDVGRETERVILHGGSGRAAPGERSRCEA